MATIVRVPLNTMLADLDETLRAMLKRELGTHGFDGVEIAFDAPDKEWSAQLSTPTVSLFLYDLREAQDVRPIEWREVQTNGMTQDVRPPLRIDASFAVTAWTREVQDEHRLLSQVRAILEELNRIGGVVQNVEEEPVANAWVVVDDVGWTVTDKEGKFRFDSLREGKYKLRVRGPDGTEAEAKFKVPGAKLDVTLEPP